MLITAEMRGKRAAYRFAIDDLGKDMSCEIRRHDTT